MSSDSNDRDKSQDIRLIICLSTEGEIEIRKANNKSKIEIPKIDRLYGSQTHSDSYERETGLRFKKGIKRRRKRM